MLPESLLEEMAMFVSKVFHLPASVVANYPDQKIEALYHKAKKQLKEMEKNKVEIEPEDPIRDNLEEYDLWQDVLDKPDDFLGENEPNTRGR